MLAYLVKRDLLKRTCKGFNVRVKLKGVDHEDVSVGYVLSDPTHPVHVATHFEAQLAILEHRNIICAGYSAVVHCHTVSQEANLAALLQARRLFLFITGDAKLALVEAAGRHMAPLASGAAPVAALLAQKQRPVEIYWAP